MSVPTIIDTLYEISAQLQGIHASIKRQTELLVRMTEKPKEAAPDPKDITWQEALRCLRDLCESKDPAQCNPTCCPLWHACEKYLQGGGVPSTWEVPADE